MGMPQMSFQSNRPPPPYSHMDPDLFFPLPLVLDLVVFLPVVLLLVLPVVLPVVLPLLLLFPLELPLDGFPAGLDLVVVVDLGFNDILGLRVVSVDLPVSFFLRGW